VPGTHFTVLSSGSSGNSSLLEADGLGLLLDVGLGPRQLAGRMRAFGTSWKQIRAVLLTHTHTDHWNERTFAHLHRLRIPLYCHAEHHESLLTISPAYAALAKEGLAARYEIDVPLDLWGGLSCLPFRLCHDGGLTCGFRVERKACSFGLHFALAYAADLGSWSVDLARRLADVDLLALEFNHDVELQRASGRPPELIARVLGDDGHLSNAQAAALVDQVMALSAVGRLRHLVQLHLSQQCNSPDLARLAVGALPADVNVHTARQDMPGPRIVMGTYLIPSGNR
jgi:phosphoribosyl 1,2-cyclic phosphodiesterase